MAKKLLFFLKKYHLPILSGILIGTSYIPFPPWASFFAFVPLWLFLKDQKSLRPVVISTFITGFLLTLIGFNWVAFTLKEFGNLPWAAAIVALLGFCAIANLDILVAAVVWFFVQSKIKLKPWTSLVFLAISTAFFERHFPTVFAWNYGFPFLWVGLPISQLGELIGFQGLSSLVILSNLILLYFWQNRASKKGQLALASFIAGFLILNLFGYILYKNVAKPDSQLRTLITQANIGNQEKQYAEKGHGFREHIVSRYLTLSEQALQKSSEPVDFMVWPETALPVEIQSANFFHVVLEPVRQFVRETKTPIMTGGYGFDEKQNKTTNSFFIFNADGSLQWPFYFKSILLVFGEYIPFSDTFPKMKQWFPAGDFARGPGPQVQTLNDLKIGPQICYESLFSEFSRGLALQGAHVIVNMTNDSWYGEWQEPYQHGYMTLARAIEYRLPLVRSTNTGISTVILANGDVLEKSPLGQEWAQIYNVPYIKNPKLTFYAKFPWLIDALLIIVVLALAGRGVYERRNKTRPN
jgi:apolipoprotein N-acyltransferase